MVVTAAGGQNELLTLGGARRRNGAMLIQRQRKIERKREKEKEREREREREERETEKRGRKKEREREREIKVRSSRIVPLQHAAVEYKA
jgi:hypothetical protein